MTAPAAQAPGDAQSAAQGSAQGLPVAWVTTLALLVVVTRWPFRTQYLFNWDAANFALATRHFDVALHQPHPPGYPYFVGLGALISLITGDANAALVAASMLLEALAVMALYLLGTRLFGHRAGLAAALLLVVSVTFWSYGELALAYPALAAFSTLVAYFAYRCIVLRNDLLLPCAMAYGLGSGFRPDLALFLLPLLLASCYRRPVGRVALALAVALGGVLLWLLPVMALSGGPSGYWEVSWAYFGADVVERYAPTARGLAGLTVNLRDTGQYLLHALYAEALVVAGGILLLLWRRPRGDERATYLFLLGWMAPMAVFYVFVHIGDPGYVFSMLPALLLLGIGGWRRMLSGASEQGRTLAACGLALALLANTLLFLLHQRPLTLPGLRASDAGAAARLDYLRSHRPQEVLLVSYDSYKSLRYYLPQYTNSVWLDTATPRRQVFPIPAEARWAILLDPSVFALAQRLPAEAEALPGETWAARLPVRAGQALVYEGGRLTLEP